MYALVAAFAVGIEAIGPVVWDVAALDSSIVDVCVFHCTVFFSL